MTGYHITIGYNSGHHKEEVWEELKNIVNLIRNNPQQIAEELLAVEKFGPNYCLPTNSVESVDEDTIREFAQYYKKATDATLQILEDEDIEKCQIMQLASSGGGYRDLKEQLRRAFCRVVLREMHKRGMEVNIIVS